VDTIHFIREEKLAPNADIQILKLENIAGLKDIPDKDNGNTLFPTQKLSVILIGA
jgi:hypothetical protein